MKKSNFFKYRVVLYRRDGEGEFALLKSWKHLTREEVLQQIGADVEILGGRYLSKSKFYEISALVSADWERGRREIELLTQVQHIKIQ